MKITDLAKQARKTLSAKGIKPTWFFKTEAVRYGIAIVDGKPWSFTLSAARGELRGRQGLPVFLSPTPSLAKGFSKAKAQLGF